MIGPGMLAELTLNYLFIPLSWNDKKQSERQLNYKNDNDIKRFSIENSPLDGTVQSDHSAIICGMHDSNGL